MQFAATWRQDGPGGRSRSRRSRGQGYRADWLPVSSFGGASPPNSSIASGARAGRQEGSTRMQKQDRRKFVMERAGTSLLHYSFDDERDEMTVTCPGCQCAYTGSAQPGMKEVSGARV